MTYWTNRTAGVKFVPSRREDGRSLYQLIYLLYIDSTSLLVNDLTGV